MVVSENRTNLRLCNECCESARETMGQNDFLTLVRRKYREIFTWLLGRRWAWKGSESLIYPCVMQREPRVILDKICDSMYYLWFDPELSVDMVMIRIQRVCWKTWAKTLGHIDIDNGYIHKGRIVIRVNLACDRDDRKMFWGAILEIIRILSTTTNIKQRSNFMSDWDDLASVLDEKSER